MARHAFVTDSSAWQGGWTILYDDGKQTRTGADKRCQKGKGMNALGMRECQFDRHGCTKAGTDDVCAPGDEGYDVFRACRHIVAIRLRRIGT